MVLRSISACTSDSMHPSRTIPLLLVSLCPSHVYFILLTVGGPSCRRPDIDFNPRCLHPVFPLLPLSALYPPFPSVCFAEAALLHFPLTRWGTPDELIRIVWRGAILNRTCTEFFALPSRKAIVPREPRFPRCIRLSAAENNARGLANVCESWRFASRIMLSITYALRSATSAKSRREFYCGPSRYAR